MTSYQLLVMIWEICLCNFEYHVFPGGTLGLFTGISILSMTEVVFWIVRYLIKSVNIFGKKKIDY